ncbi:hypothetical protein LK994_05185 [Ferruginibacter lapsinanis]|uniref:hypothetical protein n=1 Tax=Ferruginibacter lapsinanis TaxID=563172 RepID=UPI001E2CDFA4|nr:hypothetical protein [Ferruginibacter lapsinanis]UEG50867.1 hypothetical protein LK994_05185 [Ferruginibacter lapsinanis]
MMENGITGKLDFSVGSKRFKLSFERYYLSEQIERIRVSGKEKTMELQSNRPEIKLNNKRKAVNWKIISQLNPEIYKHPLFITELTIVLEYTLDEIDFPKRPYINPKNAK